MNAIWRTALIIGGAALAGLVYGWWMAARLQ